MKKFILKFSIVVLPIIIPLFLLELGARNIPNDYSFKNSYMTLNSQDIETLVLGNSHTYLGVNPEFITSKCFNFAQVGESLDYNIRIFTKFEEDLKNVKTIIIPISYANLFKKTMILGKYNYNIYYNLDINDFPVDNLEILNRNWIDLINDFYTYYFLKKESPYIKTNDVGWYTETSTKYDLNLSRMKEVARQDTAIDYRWLNSNLEMLSSFISEQHSKGVKVIIISTPLHEGYRKFMNKKQLNKAITSGTKLALKFDNVNYYNFMNHDLFLNSDFKDADHLNSNGAKKLSLMLNTIINNNNHLKEGK